MQTSFKNIRSIISVIVVLTISFFAYLYVAKNSKSVLGPNGSEVSSATLPDDTPGKEVFELYDIVRGINFDSSVFTNSTFTNLQDLTVTLPAVSIGRDNPFAPLKGVVSSDAPTSNSKGTGGN